MEKRVLVVEDDVSLEPSFRKMIGRVTGGSRVDWATNVEDALRLIRKEQRESEDDGYDLIISDITLDGPASGFDLLNTCRKSKLKSQFVLLSGRALPNSSLPTLRKPVSYLMLNNCLIPILGRPIADLIPEPDTKIIDSIFEAVYMSILGWVLLMILFGATGQIRFHTAALDVNRDPLPVVPTIHLNMDPIRVDELRVPRVPLQPIREHKRFRWHGADPEFVIGAQSSPPLIKPF